MCSLNNGFLQFINFNPRRSRRLFSAVSLQKDLRRAAGKTKQKTDTKTKIAETTARNEEQRVSAKNPSKVRQTGETAAESFCIKFW